MDHYNSVPVETASSVGHNKPFRSSQLRIFVVDDFECVRDGLRYHIDAEPDMMLAGEADCGVAALKALLALEISAQRELSPKLLSLPTSSGIDNTAVTFSVDCGVDVVVLDMSLPDSNADHVCAKIRERWPLTQVLALAMSEDRGSVQDALASGASGYVLKRSSAEEIIRGIRAVAAGQTYIDPLLSSMIAEVLVRGKRTSDGQHIRNAASSHVELSRREEQILRLVVEGTTHKEIAAMLDISVKTVETYKARSMSKQELRSRVEIIRYGAARGWFNEMK